MDLGALNPLFGRLVDDAGLFPPTSLAMDAALARYREARAAERAGVPGVSILTHRFLCPVSRLSELRAALARPIAVGLILDTDDPATAAGKVEEALADPRLAVALLEIPPTGTDDGLPAEIPTFLEVARGDLDAIERIAGRAGAGLGVKVRCGGVHADLFPTVDELAAFISACVAARLPFKATAGLHHAVRYTDEQTGFTHHGFLNLLVATGRALAGGAVKDALASEDGPALAKEAAELTDDAARAVRGVFASYGSATLVEPVTDLEQLGLLTR